jgi:hypothetical protein
VHSDSTLGFGYLKFFEPCLPLPADKPRGDEHGSTHFAWLTPSPFVIEGLAVPATRRSMRL